MALNRRAFILGAFASGRRAAGGALSSAIIGANTAITGCGLYKAVDLLRGLGFATIEIHTMGSPQAIPGRFPGFEFDQLSSQEKAKLRAALRDFRHVTTHLPYTGLDYLARDEALAKLSQMRIRVALEGTAYTGAELAVIHVSRAAGHTLDEVWPVMIRRLREWGDFAKRANFRLALETGYPASVKDFVRLVREIDHSHVGCTIDVGHQSTYEELAREVSPEQRNTPRGIRAYNDVTHAIIDGLKDKVFHLHVHDIEPSTWKEHHPIGTGFVDYPRLIRKLEEIDFKGVLVLEIAAPAADMPAHLAESKRRIEAFLQARG